MSSVYRMPWVVSRAGSIKDLFGVSFLILGDRLGFSKREVEWLYDLFAAVYGEPTTPVQYWDSLRWLRTFFANRTCFSRFMTEHFSGEFQEEQLWANYFLLGSSDDNRSLLRLPPLPEAVCATALFRERNPTRRLANETCLNVLEGRRQGLTLAAIGRSLGVSAERIRQREERAKDIVEEALEYRSSLWLRYADPGYTRDSQRSRADLMVSQLSLRYYTRRVLGDAHVVTAGQLDQLSERELLELPGLGRVSVTEIMHERKAAGTVANPDAATQESTPAKD